jgi:hypothetical protein
MDWVELELSHLGNSLSSVPEVYTSSGVGLCEEILNQTQSNIVAHLVQLLVNLHVIAFVVLA